MFVEIENSYSIGKNFFLAVQLTFWKAPLHELNIFSSQAVVFEHPFDVSEVMYFYSRLYLQIKVSFSPADAELDYVRGLNIDLRNKYIARMKDENV